MALLAGRPAVLKASAGRLGDDLICRKSDPGRRFASIPTFTGPTPGVNGDMNRRYCSAEHEVNVVVRITAVNLGRERRVWIGVDLRITAGNDEPVGHGPPLNRCWMAARPGVEAWSSAWSGHAPPGHSHDAYQVSLTRAGRGHFVCRGNRIECPPGGVVLIEPGEVHEVAPDGASAWQFDRLYIDEEAIRGVSVPSGVGLIPATPAATEIGLASRFSRLHRAVVGGSPVIEQEVHLAGLVRSLFDAGSTSPRRPPPAPVLDRVREFLDECPEVGVSLADLAALSGLSPSHLTRSFRRAFGHPPHAYLVQARVRRARALLRRGMPVIEVAARSGFADQAHLTRHFRRLVGVTPGHYRSGSRDVQDRLVPGPISLGDARHGKCPQVEGRPPRSGEPRTTMDADSQNRLILDQFTRQAEPFARLPAHATDESMRLALDAAGVGPDDNILDVACGPGLVSCAFAAKARHVKGIDLTPAMIEQARTLQREVGLENLSWHVGDVSSLPFADGSFSVAFTRYSFHHLLDPGGVLAEMVRVTEPGGRVVVVDVYTSSPEQAKSYNHVERLRDPSHVRALGLDELGEMFHDAGLGGVARSFSRLDVDLEELLGSCFPDPGDDEEIRRTFATDIGRDRLGVGARREGGRIRFAFPIIALTGRKPL